LRYCAGVSPAESGATHTLTSAAEDGMIPSSRAQDPRSPASRAETRSVTESPWLLSPGDRLSPAPTTRPVRGVAAAWGVLVPPPPQASSASSGPTGTDG
jgi:hypothetical protein